MPSDRKLISYRPDETEELIIKALAKKHGLPMARIIGQALREKAEREGVKVEASTDKSPENP
jgi:hypothetical protein